jgi:hypothetical protein
VADILKSSEVRVFGEIRPDSLYRATEACRRLGWSATAYRTARRRGLAVKYFANRAYVTGKAISDFIATEGRDTKNSRG